MRPLILDPTAGQRAREIRAYPGAPQLIPDPTDPRCGELLLDSREQGDAQRIFDPTDPAYGETPA